MSVPSVAFRVVVAALTLVGVASAVFTVVTMLQGKTSDEVASEQARLKSDWWRNPSLWASVVAFLVVAFVLSKGLGDLLRLALGFEPAIDYEGDRLSIGEALGFFVAVVVAQRVVEVRKLATRCADLENELATRDLLKPFRDAWGAEWTKALEGLQGQLADIQKDPYASGRQRSILAAAVSRAEWERHREKEGRALARAGDGRRRPAAIHEGTNHLSMLLGRRIWSLSCAEDGTFLQIVFTDRSCYLAHLSEGFLSGTFYRSLVEGLADTQHLGPNPAQLRVVNEPDEAKQFNAALLRRFVALWDKAGTQQYVKAEWIELDGMLTRLGMRG